MRPISPACPRLAVLATLFLLGTLVGPVLAQESCETLLEEARARYRLGHFELALESLDACLTGRCSREEKARVYELQAKVYLAVDDVGAARKAIQRLLGKEPGFSPRADVDPAPFVELVEAQREQRSATLIGSVSKTPEDLREAPATVVVVTAEEIERRGYLDLEAVLHDLPGFDISRGNGEVYSSLYQRGYRSARNDRLLFLIDGVEQNDLHSNTAYISRQYPLSNVERIEVVYGPASTLYGANAYTGVIQVITKDPEKGKRLAGEAQVAGGSFNTWSFDVTLTGSSPRRGVEWSLAARRYRSDEMSLSGFEDWDYDFGEAVLDGVDYKDVMRVEGERARQLEEDDQLSLRCGSLCTVETDEAGNVTSIELTDEGQRLARARDQRLFDSLRAEPVGFSDQTDDKFVYVKVKVSNLELGFQTWRREEGTTPWYTDQQRAGRDAGSVWIPRQISFYLNYSRPIGSEVTLSFFSRLKEHDLDSGTSVSRFGTYANEFLDVVELVRFNTLPFFQKLSLDQSSSQFRNELTLIYEASERFQLVAGIESRNNSIQADYVSSLLTEDPEEDFPFFFPLNVREKVESRDLGFFAQASFRPATDLKVVVGGRFDENELEDSQEVSDVSGRDSTGIPRKIEPEGFGSVFTPRLALIYTPGDFVFKAIYAEAFKEPSNFQKYTREPGVRELVNENLDEERVDNVELSAGWYPRQGLAFELSGYESTYSDIVVLRERFDPDFYPATTGQFDALGSLRIRGLQASASLRYERYDVYGNYTYTDPVNTDPTNELGEPVPGLDELRLGDIARHQLNLGVNYRFRKRFNLNVRANYVGTRKTGDGTTVSSNPLREIDAYFVTHASLSWRDLVRGATLQLIVNNLFDSEYDHPGVERAGRGFAARIPQQEQAVFLRLAYRY